MASKTPAAPAEAVHIPSKDQIIDMYRRLNMELQQVQERMFDLQNKAEEHDLVAECISKLPPERKCCRLVSGVLVERTVAQVLPVVKGNSVELKKAIEGHRGLLEKKQKELSKFMADYKIEVKGSSDGDQQQTQQGNQGVLVS